ncbi:TPA: phage tail protein [Escherichia coli]|nr:phage tail protein [Escherichia coli]HAW4332407.1 phage tail protein [Escherichia coli]HBB2304886.1 phage tail protein [Escherichia coli]
MPQLKGVIKTPTGEPLGGATITLTSLHNRAGILKSVFSHVTTQNGEYDFPVLPGVYSVRLTQSTQRLSEIGVIRVYEDSTDGSLNDFLGATDIDLRPEALKKFEELAQQAQQSAEKAGEHATAAEQARQDTETLAGEIQQDAEEIAGNVQKAEKLASETNQNAARAEQAVKDADKIVQKAVDKLADAATLTGEAKASAEAAAKSEQNAKSHADNAAGSAQQTAQDVTATETARDDAERFANEAENSAQTSGAARDESVDAAEHASQHKEAASSAATSAENAANVALGHENNAAEYARQAKASQDASEGNAQEAKRCRDEAQQIVDDLKGSNATTTEKGLVQLCSDTDNDSEELAATPKAVKVVMDETNTKAPLDSPAFTGTPTTPTPPDDATGLEMANAAFVRKLLAALVDSSPEALDTLNELAAALGNDPNFATTVTKALAGKQPLNDVLTAVGQITPRKNSLLYYNESGNLTLTDLTGRAKSLLGLGTYEKMRALLELKAAATMDPQSDIRDRTPGRLALPGAFGFGYAFSQSERLDFNSDEKFLEWVKNATEGRYFIYSYNSKIFPDRNSFTGIVDVNLFPSGSSNGNPAKTDKGLFFYSRYQPDSEQSVFYVQYSSVYADGVVTWGLTSVRNLSLTSKMLSEYLSSTAGAGTYFQYPGIGVPVLAVYRGTAAGDNEIRIGLGDVVHGSCLGSVNITCLIGATGVYSSTPRVGASAYSFPGRYMAISGDRGSYGDEGHICLFVRIE